MHFFMECIRIFRTRVNDLTTTLKYFRWFVTRYRPFAAEVEMYL